MPNRIQANLDLFSSLALRRRRRPPGRRWPSPFPLSRGATRGARARARASASSQARPSGRRDGIRQGSGLPGGQSRRRRHIEGMHHLQTISSPLSPIDTLISPWLAGHYASLGLECVSSSTLASCSRSRLENVCPKLLRQLLLQARGRQETGRAGKPRRIRSCR